MSTPDFGQGLIPAVVQHARSGAVLMVAFMNQQAWESTIETGWAHFWSRSRNELWQKGATSGNRLRVESVSLDCDADTVLLFVEPEGPTCHTGARSCFADVPSSSTGMLFELDAVIASRAIERPTGSYTTELLDGGTDAVGRKLIEESTEVLLAARDHAAGDADDRRVAEEAADLLFHLMVALRERGLGLDDAVAVLESRR